MPFTPVTGALAYENSTPVISKGFLCDLERSPAKAKFFWDHLTSYTASYEGLDVFTCKLGLLGARQKFLADAPFNSINARRIWVQGCRMKSP